MLYAKIQAIAEGDQELKGSVITAARENFLDPKWFIDTYGREMSQKWR